LLQRKIEAAAVAALTMDDTRKRLSGAGIEIATDGSAALSDRIAVETGMWRAIVAKSGIKPLG
jgi:hypothetical protein